MRDHTILRAFELANEIAVLISKVSKGFPKDEIYGLSAQMIRSMNIPIRLNQACEFTEGKALII